MKLTGVWRQGKNVHDYKVPNNPDANEWNNLCLEDIGIFWDLPNWDEAKYYYFHAVQVNGEHSTGMEEMQTPVRADKPDEVISQHYGWKWHESKNQTLFRSFGAVSAVSFAMALLAF